MAVDAMTVLSRHKYTFSAQREPRKLPLQRHGLKMLDKSGKPQKRLHLKETYGNCMKHYLLCCRVSYAE